MNRNKFMKLAVLAVMALIVARLFVIQIIEHDSWLEKAAAQQTMQSTIKAQRGEIYMLDGDQPVAVVMNATIYTVIIDPLIADRAELEAKLTPLLGEYQTAAWDDAFANQTLRYYVVARGLGRTAAEAVAAADLSGVWLQATTERVYPEGELASTVLGFVNADGVGQYGIEGAMNQTLSGTDGLLRTIKDVNNVALSIGDDNIKIPAVDGENVVLTIDKTLQFNVEKILAAQSAEMGFANMSAVVLDPNSGKVLAMANHPNYDPADYGNVVSAADYINHVVEDPYEPASVCKTFTFAAAIEKGVMTPESTYNNTGMVEIDGWPIYNTEQSSALLGNQTMQIAFNYSLNTGSIQALRWIGGSETEITVRAREILYEFYHDRFGLGQATGIELIESEGIVQRPDIQDGANSTYANMTFGQNMQVTMIQVAAAMASLVNGGYYYTPTIVAGRMVDDVFTAGYWQDGEFVASSADPEPVRQTVSAATSSQIREMLYGTRRAWRANGTDQPGYYVGGKTGTAQVIKDGAYSSDATGSSYIGVGGTEGELPSYLIMVRVWEDGKLADGQKNALPVFNALKTYVEDYLKIRPSTTSSDA